MRKPKENEEKKTIAFSFILLLSFILMLLVYIPSGLAIRIMFGILGGGLFLSAIVVMMIGIYEDDMSISFLFEKEEHNDN